MFNEDESLNGGTEIHCLVPDDKHEILKALYSSPLLEQATKDSLLKFVLGDD